MSRAVLLSLYAGLVLIWSSTWVAIKFGLEDTPPLLGAGVRFAIAGLVLLAVAAARRRPLRTDRVLAATLACLPFALSYGLIYWGEQYIPSGLTAVLFGVMPLYVALLASVLLREESIHRRLVAGILVAIAGLVVAFGESLALGDEERAAIGAAAVLVSPMASAAGNVAIKLRGGALDAVVLNGWAMSGAGMLLLLASALTESWGEAAWTGKAVGAIAYLAIIGSSVTFVTLTVLLRHLSTVTVSYIPLLLPFGALLFGAALYDEDLTLLAAIGGALVAAGLLVAQFPGRRRPADPGAAPA